MVHILIIILTLIYSFNIKSTLLTALSSLFIIMTFIAIKKFKNLEKVLEIITIGAKKSYLLVIIFALLGALSASWFISGTIPALIYYGIKIINPKYFYICSFVITSIFSFLIGSSFGTVGTIGIVMISLAKGMDINTSIVAGTIISGAYFGDRGSPMSSSANFVSILTETNLYSNVRRMFKSSIIPYILSFLLYFYNGKNIEIKLIENNILNLLNQEFNLNFIVLIPLVYLIVMCILKKNIRYTMVVSIILSLIIAAVQQTYNKKEYLNFLISGFKLPLENELYDIIRGGGVLSMSTAMVMALLSCSLVSIIESMGFLKWLSEKIGILKKEWKIYLYTILVAIFTAGISSSQSTSILLTSQIMKRTYERSNYSKEKLAIDIENSSVILSPLIPWNIGITVPALMLNTQVGEILPYSYYLFLLPLIVIALKIKKLRYFSV